MGYQAFARYYDRFTGNVEYSKRAAYFHRLFAFYGCRPHTLLDLACGTGSLTFALAEKGYQLIATDASLEMLTVAEGKKQNYPQLASRVQFVQQSMEEVALPQPVDAVLSTLDSINHLPDQQALQQVFTGVSQAVKPEGLFIFDVNTPFKHQEVLGDNTFILEDEQVFLCWQNQYHEEHDRVEIWLDFFEEQSDGSYLREQEVFSERIFTYTQLKDALEACGFQLLDVFGENSTEAPSDEEERLIYIARRLR